MGGTDSPEGHADQLTKGDLGPPAGRLSLQTNQHTNKQTNTQTNTQLFTLLLVNGTALFSIFVSPHVCTSPLTNGRHGPPVGHQDQRK